VEVRLRHHAIDACWTLNSPELYARLVGQCAVSLFDDAATAERHTARDSASGWL